MGEATIEDGKIDDLVADTHKEVQMLKIMTGQAVEKRMNGQRVKKMVGVMMKKIKDLKKRGKEKTLKMQGLPSN